MTKLNDPKIYRRNLPHIQPKNSVFFLTYTLSGSLPFEKFKILKEERDFQIRKLKEEEFKPEALKLNLAHKQEFYFGKFDELLDEIHCGPIHLRHPDVANLVKESIHYLFESGTYKLISYTIMPNHVHKIIYKIQKPLFRIMQSHEGYTGNVANRILDLKGQFWQPESYDHLIRNRESLRQKINYTLNNPVKAGLTKHWREFEHTYLNPEFEKFVDL